MTLQQLEYIVALDTYKHFVTAAKKSYVTQPTLTMQVKKLEDEIGVQLFDRSKKPLRTTPAGELIVAKSREILREVEQIKAYVTSEKEDLSGTFQIGVIPTLAPYVLPRFLQDFKKANPQTKLIIREMQTLQIIKALKEDRIDIGLLVTPLEERTIREIPLFNEPFLLYHPKEGPFVMEHSIDAEDLDPKSILILNEGHCFRNQALNICNRSEAGDALGFEFESGSLEALMRMVDQGLGYTLIPGLACEENPKNPQVKTFKEPQPVREVSLVCHKSFSKQKLIDALHDCILDNIPDSYQKNERFIRVKWR